MKWGEMVYEVEKVMFHCFRSKMVGGTVYHAESPALQKEPALALQNAEELPEKAAQGSHPQDEEWEAAHSRFGKDALAPKKCSPIIPSPLPIQKIWLLTGACSIITVGKVDFSFSGRDVFARVKGKEQMIHDGEIIFEVHSQLWNTSYQQHRDGD
ncbi:hypothetical protein B0H10DRAFT_1947157 [Mycena sp. CBHHK59/15]|nr:hypothetical protein B0H10DRAFT_1947157 [Mycena sp. CBHHK59/15]